VLQKRYLREQNGDAVDDDDVDPLLRRPTTPRAVRYNALANELRGASINRSINRRLAESVARAYPQVSDVFDIRSDSINWNKLAPTFGGLL